MWRLNFFAKCVLLAIPNLHTFFFFHTSENKPSIDNNSSKELAGCFFSLSLSLCLSTGSNQKQAAPCLLAILYAFFLRSCFSALGAPNFGCFFCFFLAWMMHAQLCWQQPESIKWQTFWQFLVLDTMVEHGGTEGSGELKNRTCFQRLIRLPGQKGVKKKKKNPQKYI